MRQSARWFGWRPDKPDHRDLRLPKASAGEMPASAMLLGDFLPPIRDQGDQGSCVGHCVRSALQYKRAVLGQDELELSPRFAYYNARLIEGTTGFDAGAEIRNGIKGVHKLGIASEDTTPYSDKIVRRRPSGIAYREAQQDVLASYARVDNTEPALKQAILAGDPIVFGFSVFENFDDNETANTGKLGMPSGEMTGGHAVWIVGYDDDQVIRDQTGGFLIGNSWGNDWGVAGPNGERGYFWAPYAYLTDPQLADDFWSVQLVT
jgi:C1A family cysteine protease